MHIVVLVLITAFVAACFYHLVRIAGWRGAYAFLASGCSFALLLALLWPVDHDHH